MAARSFVEQGFPPAASWTRAAAVRTRSGKTLLSTRFFDIPNDAVRICHETDAICEAHKLDEEIVDSLC